MDWKSATDIPAAMTCEAYRLIVEPKWKQTLETASAQERHDERTIQRFLEQHPCLIPGAIGLRYGLHGPFPPAVISQPKLNGLGKYVPDFMWITSDSSRVCPVLIEIESPNKKWFTDRGNPTAELTQAANQITKWKAWFSKPENLLWFRAYYKLPERLLRDRPLKPHYILIYGRRSEATEHERVAETRFALQRESETWMTFDRLVPSLDSMAYLCVRKDDDHYKALTFPPTFQLGPHVAAALSMINDREMAIDHSPYTSAERQAFLKSRLAYSDEWASGSRPATSSSIAE